MERDEPLEDEVAQLRAAGPEQPEALARVLDRYRARLLRMVQLRMHPALRGRVGASDVLQDAYLQISARLAKYLSDPAMPFFLWVRFLTAQTLLALQRRHLGAQKRDARRELQLARSGFPSATSVAIVDRLVAAGTTPTQAVVQDELRAQLEGALDRMDELDREVLVLRHFEELKNVEAARELGIEPKAASKRYIRALRRLRQVLDDVGLRTGEDDP